LAEEADRRRLFSYLEQRFGISQTHFADYLLFRKKQSWFLIRDTQFVPSVSQLKVAQAGLRAFQQVGDFVKPTTRFIQGFGQFATRARLYIDLTQLQALLRGEKIHVDMTLDNGYVILVIGDNGILGLGLYVNGRISSQLPRKEIRSAML
jgi:NOL1/NOP2/fmu family ribosome biogenesis protein